MSDSSGYRGYRDADSDTESVLAQLRGVLQGLRFGSVTIIVQDGVVVQIDRTEKRRVQPNARRLEAQPSVPTATPISPQRTQIISMAQETRS